MGYNSGDIIKNVNQEFSKLWTALNNELSKRVKTGNEGSSTNQYTAYNTAKGQAHPETQNSSITSNPYAQYILNIVKNSHLAGASNLPAKGVGDIIPNLTAYYTVVNNAAAATENTANGGCDGACTGYCVGSCFNNASKGTEEPGKNNICNDCSTICYSSCYGNCYLECDSNCGYECNNNCADGCYGGCVTTCGGCTNGCQNTCQGDCNESCSGTCSSGCVSGCMNGAGTLIG